WASIVSSWEYTVSGWLALFTFARVADSGAPAQLGEIDGACWDASSLAVIEARKLHLPNSVEAFWDFMAYLHTSPQPGHHSAFMKLAQLFWERYVDCVLSRAHGLGRRGTIIISRD
ncbi:protein FAM237A, partial [Astyanax mexicanus]|uniref:Family with sequence similarity 237 member B n=2 Tax=Astyanax mexicanus TaxID=7994 RepID=A0A3B1K7W9_ASTMX